LGQRIFVALALLGFCFVCGTSALGAPPDRYQSARDQLVAEAITSAGITNPRVVQAIRTTPRHEFVPAPHRKNAYLDMALPIGEGQTISPPYIVAFMTQTLDPQPTDRVLEIGTGSGYQAAVLGAIAKEVYSIEIVESLGNRAAQTLKRLRYENVHTKVGDGFQGWREHAPFDKIIVTCSPENIPQPLIDQLVEGGRIVVPLGSRFEQTLYLFVKESGKLRQTALESTFFVPMTGQAEANRQEHVEERVPQLRYTSFEQKFDDTEQPEGWYYARQARVIPDAQAPDGQHVLELSNATPGRPAHVVQSFGVDGRVAREMQLKFAVSGTNCQVGAHREEAPGVLVEFYNDHRAAVGRTMLGPWSGSFDWRQEESKIRIPKDARLAIIGLGLFGGTGSLRFDNLELNATQVIQDADELDSSSHPPARTGAIAGSGDTTRKNDQ
jgi:protein-L-isoaspartate(D-aspartate) O-methyltransferase